MSQYHVLVADAIDPEGLAPLLDDPRFEVVTRAGLKGDALADAIATADAVLVRSATRITRESLSRATRLKVIGRAGVGVDTIDVDAATERGVAVMNAPAGNTVSAAELSFALLLALARRIPQAMQSMRDGKWERTPFQGVELSGKTLGLVGAGRVGGEVARRARGFEMHVLAYDPFLSPEGAAGLGVELVDLPDLLRTADIVSLHVPLTDATRNLLGPKELGLLKRSAMIVNASRGGVIDESALVKALDEGAIAGAALDVFAREPLPADDPLRRLSNVVLTPHLGASTEEAQRSVALEIALAVRAALLDGDLAPAVNAPLVGGERLARARPLLELAQRLGYLAAALAGPPASSVEVRLHGEGDDLLRSLASYAAVGVLQEALGAEGVNLVNALHLAHTRGIAVGRTRVEGSAGPERLEVRVGGARPVRVEGMVLTAEVNRVTRIDDFRVDVMPAGSLVILRNHDVPGVIGRVGTVLGNAGVNIAEYHQSRLARGKDALAVIRVDVQPGPDVLSALRGLPEVESVQLVAFPAGRR